MDIDITSSNILPREKRLLGISAYYGMASDLPHHGCTGCGNGSGFRGCGRSFSQPSSCLTGAFFDRLMRVQGIAIIHHGPAGCSMMGISQYTAIKRTAMNRGMELRSPFISTDMNERDMIFGSTGKLREIILTTYNRYHPDAIFVSTSCASGIIGEDIDSVVDDVKAEIPVPVIACHCEGFKSRIWATAFDIADHAVLSGIVKPSEKKSNTVIFANFYESARQEVIDLFHRFDLEPLLIYANCTVEELSRMSEALCTVSICATLGDYLGNGLEQVYGVPYVRTLSPVGITGFETWLQAIGQATGRQEAVEAYIAEQRAIYMPQIEEVCKDLKGLRCVLGMGPGFTLEAARLFNEFGIEVVWAMGWHYDQKYADGGVPPATQYLADNGIDFPFSASEQQNYEILHVLEVYKPDFYVSRHSGSAVWATKQGTPVVSMGDEFVAFGYKRTLDFAKIIRMTVRKHTFVDRLSAHTALPYQAWWFDQDMKTFTTQEKHHG